MSKILVVDDNASICESLTMALQFEGHAVECAANEIEMISKIRQFSPHLILLDMLISGEDGCAICQSLLMSKTVKAPPIVIMSAHPDGAMRAKECGATAFLPKPFELDHLYTLVREHARVD